MRRSVSAAIALLVAEGAVPALAQDIRIEVTGSNIRRPEGEGALPVQIITREQIDRTGAQTAAELLQFVTANTSFGTLTAAHTVGAFTHSVSTASLRGLGGQNTLVLLNGKRLTATSGEDDQLSGVNLDSIPFLAVERVEILKDGASAIYGSDAVAGVINFVLRQDFRGAEAALYYGAPTRGGGGQKWNAKGTVGFGDLTKDKYNVFFSAYYQKAESLDTNKRSFSDSSIDVERGLVLASSYTFPAHITTGGIGVPQFPNCSPSIYDPTLDPLFGMRCVYDFAAVDGVHAIPKQETTSFFASGRWQFNPHWQLYGTAAHTKVDTRHIVAPMPIAGGPFLLPPSSPYYPTALAEAAGVNGQPLSLRYRAHELGHRDRSDENEAFHGVAGIKGTAFKWDFDFDFVFSRNVTKSRLNGGFARDSAILPLLNSGRVNPFGPSTPDVQAELEATQVRDEEFRGESAGWLVEGKASGDLLKLPAGSVAAAFGFQAGQQKLEQRFNPSVSDRVPPNIDAARDLWAAFAEINIPIVNNLELNAGVRYDDYSDFGRTTNPKVSMRWNPIRQLLLRGSWGTGFVVPTLTQAYGANSIVQSFFGFQDSLRCPTTQDDSDCLTEFNLLFGGNANLQPQKSDQWTLGFVFEPLTGLSVAFDWFNLKVKDMFGGPSTETILNNQDQYGHLITRGPVQPQFPTLPGPIVLIDQRIANIGNVNIEGWDVSIKATGPKTDWGQLSFNVDGSYYTRYDVRNPDGTFTSQISNTLFSPISGVIPRYTQYATFGWSRGPWAASLGHLYQSSYVDGSPDGNGDPRRVGSLSLWDFHGSYSGFKNWKLALGVQNLFDRDPPFSNQGNSGQVGYDPHYDGRARFVYGSVTYSFQ